MEKYERNRACYSGSKILYSLPINISLVFDYETKRGVIFLLSGLGQAWRSAIPDDVAERMKTYLRKHLPDNVNVSWHDSGPELLKPR